MALIVICDICKKEIERKTRPYYIASQELKDGVFGSTDNNRYKVTVLDLCDGCYKSLINNLNLEGSNETI